ncbi:DUF4160 domain-containing protein [Myxococcota bacterium]|nr:DUF4160 domain-containing protein [Myxococcota bacterium]
MAPTVLREGPYRFFFFLNEGNEPAHIHVDAGDRSAKFWLDPVSLASSRHMPAHEINALLEIVLAHRDRFLEVWNERFPRGR